MASLNLVTTATADATITPHFIFSGTTITYQVNSESPVSMTSDIEASIAVLTGDTVTFAIGEVTGVTKLSFYGDKLSFDLSDISVLINLTTLNLGSTDITGELSDISGLTSLTYLRLDATDITGSLSSISGLTDLTALYLYTTDITGSLSDISGLTNLIILSLSSTSVTGPLSGISGLTSLTYLSLHSTDITGDLSGISTLINLTYLHLGLLPITGELSDISGLTSLTSLSLYSTDITGELSDISALINLNYVYLYDTNVTYSGSLGSHPNNGGGWVTGLYDLDETSYQGMFGADGSVVGVGPADASGNFAKSLFTSPPLQGMICNVDGTRGYIDGVADYDSSTYAISFLNLVDNTALTASEGDAVYFGGCLADGADAVGGVPDADVTDELDNVSRIVWTNVDQSLTYSIAMPVFVGTSLSSNLIGSAHWIGFYQTVNDNPRYGTGQQPKFYITTANDFDGTMIDFSAVVNYSMTNIHMQRPNSSVSGRYTVETDTDTKSMRLQGGEVQGGYRGLNLNNSENISVLDVIIRDCYNQGIYGVSASSLFSNVKIYNIDGSGFIFYMGICNNVTVSGCGSSGFLISQDGLPYSQNAYNLLSYGNSNDFYVSATIVMAPILSNCVSGDTMPDELKQMNPLGWGIDGVDPQFISTNPASVDFLVPSNSVVRDMLGLPQSTATQRLRARYE